MQIHFRIVTEFVEESDLRVDSTEHKQNCFHTMCEFPFLSLCIQVVRNRYIDKLLVEMMLFTPTGIPSSV